jgi:hypothetical protein
MIPARRAFAFAVPLALTLTLALVLVLAIAVAAPAAAPPAPAVPPVAPAAPMPAAAASDTDPDPRAAAPAAGRARVAPRADYVAQVEREAQAAGVRVHWVNPPERREVRSRTLRLRATLPARESCHGPGCPERADD